MGNIIIVEPGTNHVHDLIIIVAHSIRDRDSLIHFIALVLHYRNIFQSCILILCSTGIKYPVKVYPVQWGDHGMPVLL